MEGGRGVGAGRRVGSLLAVGLLLAACGSDSDTPADSTAPVTASPTTATTEPTAAATEPTTSTSSASASSEPPPTGSVMGWTEQVVSDAVDRAATDYSACLVSMPSCDPARLQATRGDPLLTINVARINEWNNAGYTVVDRDQFRYVIEDVELSPDEQQATVTVCVADGSKLVQPGGGPDGADVIIDGSFVSGREAWDMRLGDDGFWRVHDAPAVGATEATDVCPAT